MKAHLDKNKILDLMAKNNIGTFKELCQYCGIENYGSFMAALNKNCASPEISWLIADSLDVDIMDIWSVDWDRDARRSENGNNS